MDRQVRRQTIRLIAWGVVAVVAAGLCACGKTEAPQYSNRVDIKADPEVGAEIFVDGEAIGTTPFTLENLPPRMVLLQLKKAGYRDKWESVVVPEQGSKEYIFKLDQIKGYLSIGSDPEGATVELADGRSLGKTPIERVELPLGRYEYEVRLENFEPQTNVVQIENDSLYKYSHKLKADNGSLVVFSTPSGASLWLNNQLQPERTPARLSVAPGIYTVSVHTEGHVMAEEIVTVDPAGEKRIELKMAVGNALPGMLLVPGGEFLMGADEGSPDERPGRQVSVDAFYIDKYEVTNEQYKVVYPAHEFEKGQENFPVTGVSWLEAVKFAEAVGKRLPTEAEWEKAARGTDGRQYPWGEKFDKSRCNSKEAGIGKPEEVGTYLNGASPYGVMDMAGNVSEWVADWYNPYPGNEMIDKNYGQVYRVLRGGSYESEPYDVRCLRRGYGPQDMKRPDVGFRCAASVNR